MTIMKNTLRMCIPVLCMLALFAGPAAAALTVDGDFNASGSYDGSDNPNQTSSDALRTNGAGQDWYESRASVPQKVMLYSNTTEGVYGNYTNMARFRYGQPSYSGAGYSYLTQDFSSAQSGRFSVSFDIAIGITTTDHVGMIYIGTDNGVSGGPNNVSAERFVSLGFYGPAGETTGQLLQLKANNGAVAVTGTNALFYDTWYTLTIDVNVPGGTYDVTVDDTNGTATYIKTTGIAANANQANLRYLSFAIGQATSDTDEGKGTFYVDNVSAVPIPGAVWLLGSGLLGLVAIRRRMKK